MGQAHATTVSYTQAFGPLETDWIAPQTLLLPQFNPTIGTLNSVTFRFDGGISSGFSATNPTGSAKTVTYEAAGTLNFQQATLGNLTLDLGPQDGSLALGPLGDLAFTIDLSASVGTTLFSGWSDFLGGGNFGVDVTAFGLSSMSEDSGNVEFDVASSATTGVTVTYDYTANRNSVPEPASLALVGLALCAAGAARRRRA